MSTARLSRVPTSPLKPIVAPPRPIARPVVMRRKRPAWQRVLLKHRKELMLTLLAVAVACVVAPLMAQDPGNFKVLEAAPPTPPIYQLR